MTISKASKLLSERKISSGELTKACLERIKKVEPKLNAFITVTAETALKQAAASDKRIKNKKRLGSLDGIPYAIKDSYCSKDIKTTAGSKILEDFIPPYNATVIQRLEDAGAVLLGKTNMDQFGHGSSTENSAFGPTKNPWDLTRVAGGSSGGSAAAIAADECIFAIGEDTGGSIRQPASFCSVVGLKPTYGLVSRYGSIAYGSSLDTVGPMAKSAEDIKLILKIIAGKDEKDATTIKSKIKNQNAKLQIKIQKSLKGIKIGVPKEFFGKGLDAEVEKVIKDAVSDLEKLGAKIVEVSLPSLEYAIACYYIIATAETSSNLARYDGIKYGYSIEKGDCPRTGTVPENSLYDVYAKSRARGFSAETKRRIMLGTYVLSAGYYDAYYKKAQQVRTIIKKEFEDIFRKVDVLAAPVSPIPAFKIGEKSDDPLAMYLADAMTVPINPAGIPAISIPSGFTKNNLPIGMQLIGPQMGEELILDVAEAYEKATRWNKQKPKLLLNQKS